MTLVERPPVEGTESLDLEVLFKEARRRRRRRWFLGMVLVIALSVAMVIAAMTIQFGGPPSTTQSAPANSPTPANAVSDLRGLNLDILSAQTQVSASLGESNQKPSVRLATPGIAPPLALARDGYVVGIAMGTLESVSDNLQKVLHSWASDGQYAAPASNPAYVWLSDPYGQPSQAQEFDEHGNPVRPAVSIPRGSIVDGQSGSFLVLQGPPPSQVLELWDPAAQELGATLGPWDQEAASASDVAWTTGHVLHLETTANRSSIDIDGPSGDWAESISFSPNGRRIAIVWAPLPGTESSRDGMVAKSTLSVLDVELGTLQTVPDSSGALGPLAWAPDGAHLFFARSIREKSGIESYAISSELSTILIVQNVHLPADFSAATGALIVWQQ